MNRDLIRGDLAEVRRNVGEIQAALKTWRGLEGAIDNGELEIALSVEASMRAVAGLTNVVEHLVEEQAGRE